MRTPINKLMVEINRPLPIKGTNYLIDLNGDIYNKRTGVKLKSNYSKYGQRNTVIYFKPLFKVHVDRRRSKQKRKIIRKTKTIANARQMLETYFIINFKYKILYKDGDKSNTHMSNLIIRKNVTFDTIDGNELITVVEKTYREGDYQKIIIKDV